MCGIGEASRRQPKSRYTELLFLPPSFMAAKGGQLINKEAKPLSHDLSEEDSRHHMAKIYPQHRSFNWGFSSQHLHHLDEITASLGQSCCPHERSPPPEETALRRTVSRQALQGRQKKRLKDTLKVSMKSFGIAPNWLENLAQDRDK